MSQDINHTVAYAPDVSEESSTCLRLEDVSASVVAYKSNPHELGELLISISTCIHARHITVVDNSPDDSLRACIELTGAEYITFGRNVGFGAGHNYAFNKYYGQSKYHLVINPDIAFKPDTINALYTFMERTPNAGLVMPRILYPDGSEQRLCKQLPSPLDLLRRRFLGKLGRSLFAKQIERYGLRHLNMEIAREVPCLSGCFMFIRTSVLREVGFFDERFFMYMEDFDLCRRIGVKYATIFYPEVSVTHGYAQGSYRNLTLLKYHLRSAFRYFGKWGWIYDAERTELNKKTSPINTSPVDASLKRSRNSQLD